MPVLQLDVDSLGKLDGGAAGLIINAALRDALRDLEDRGSQDDKPRKVSIEITMSLLDNGQVATSVEAIAKMPKRKTASTIGQIKATDKGEQKLVFQEYAPEDPGQTTIHDFIREDHS